MSPPTNPPPHLPSSSTILFHQNAFSYFFTPLPTNPAFSVGKRVDIVHKLMEQKKRSPEPLMILAQNNVVKAVCGGGAVAAINNHILFRVTGYLSNLPGPQEALSMGGERITRMCNVVSPMMFGLGVSLLSYDGTITLAMSSDDNVVKVCC